MSDVCYFESSFDPLYCQIMCIYYRMVQNFDGGKF